MVEIATGTIAEIPPPPSAQEAEDAARSDLIKKIEKLIDGANLPLERKFELKSAVSGLPLDSLRSLLSNINQRIQKIEMEENSEKTKEQIISAAIADAVEREEEMSEPDLLMCVRPKNREELAQGLSKLTKLGGIGPTAEDVKRLLEHPSTLDAQIKYNGASEESREEAVKAQHDRTRIVAKAANNKNVPEETRKVLAEANALGTAARPDAAHLTDALKKNGTLDQKQTEEWKQKNNETRQSVIKSIPVALSVASEADRKAAERVGSPDKIVEKSLALFKAQKPDKNLSEDDKAILRVFVIARTDVMFKLLGDDAIARDLEKERGGTLADRTERAYQALKDKPPVSDVPEFALRKLIGSSLEKADEKGVAVKNLDKLNQADFGKMANEISSGFFPGTVVTVVTAGAGGIKSADIDAIVKEGNRVGKGAYRWSGSEIASEFAANAAVYTGLRLGVSLNFGTDINKFIENPKNKSLLEAIDGQGRRIFDNNASGKGDGKVTAREVLVAIQNAGISLNTLKGENGELDPAKLEAALKKTIQYTRDLEKAAPELEKAGLAEMKDKDGNKIFVGKNGQISVDKIKTVLREAGVRLDGYNRGDAKLETSEIIAALKAAGKDADVTSVTQDAVKSPSPTPKVADTRSLRSQGVS
jgi:hypothetical protein